jgi:hypothetical protein
MFLSEGGRCRFSWRNGPWKTDDREFHLPKDKAKALLSMVLETYKTRFSTYPAELFIHGSHQLLGRGMAGIAEAAPPGTNVVGVRIKSTYGETKLYRDGGYPCLRGTALLLGDRDAYLWTAGYVPRIDTYLGPRDANPLYITTLRSTGGNARIDERTDRHHGAHQDQL